MTSERRQDLVRIRYEGDIQLDGCCVEEKDLFVGNQFAAGHYTEVKTGKGPVGSFEITSITKKEEITIVEVKKV